MLTNDTSCNEIYTFQKSGNIRKRSNIANAGVRNRYGSAFLKMFLDNISHRILSLVISEPNPKPLMTFRQRHPMLVWDLLCHNIPHLWPLLCFQLSVGIPVYWV